MKQPPINKALCGRIRFYFPFSHFSILFIVFPSLSKPSSPSFFVKRVRVNNPTKWYLRASTIQGFFDSICDCDSIMAGKSKFHANLPILDGKNWDTWIKQMKVIFIVQEADEHVNTVLDPLPANAIEQQRTTFREAQKKDSKALFLIH